MGYLNLSLFNKTARLGLVLGDIDAGLAFPIMNFYAGPPPATPDDVPGGALLASLPCSSPFGAISNGIDDPVVTAAGLGYTSIPTFALVGATAGSGAQFQVVMQLATLVLVAGGANYAINDLLVLPAVSLTCLQPVILKVTGVNGAGVISGVSIQQPGQFITTLPSGPVSGFETTGIGSGATFTFLTYSVASVGMLAPGQNYTSAGQSGTPLFTGGGGGSGAAASPRMTPVLTASAITTSNAMVGGVTGLARIINANGLALQIITPGSGGTDGTFPFDFLGGIGLGFVGTFTVSGGQVVGFQIENPGAFTAIPTLGTSSSSGLSGALVVASLGASMVDLDVGVAGSGASVIINNTLVVSGGPVVVTSAYIVEA